jgi:hypothetical protein
MAEERASMSGSEIAILVSGISLAVALIALAWNVWEKFIFVRPRLQVTFGIWQVIQNGKFGKSLLSLNVTNMGPGPVIIHLCIIQSPTRWFWKKRSGIINPIHNDPTSDTPISIGPFSAGLPSKLDAGDVKSFYFPYTEDTFLKESITRVGVTDTYGRQTWCRGKDAKKASRKFREDFPSTSTQADDVDKP